MVNNLGKEIIVLVDGIELSGENQLQLQANDLPAGLYFLYSQTPEGTSIHKILIN